MNHRAITIAPVHGQCSHGKRGMYCPACNPLPVARDALKICRHCDLCLMDTQCQGSTHPDCAKRPELIQIGPLDV